MMGCFSCYGEPKVKDAKAKGHLNGKTVAPLKQLNTDETDESLFRGAKIASSRERGESALVGCTFRSFELHFMFSCPVLGVEVCKL